VDKAKGHYENLSLTSACETILEIGNLGNLYIDEQAPWSCFKQGGESAEKAAKVNHMKVETIYFASWAYRACFRFYSSKFNVARSNCILHPLVLFMFVQETRFKHKLQNSLFSVASEST
jgi:hypothetical protein